MGKVKKNKETTKSATPELMKVSNYYIKPPKKLEKKIKNDKQNLKKNKTSRKSTKGVSVDVEQLQTGIEALVQYEERHNSKDLFTRDKPIFLQIDAVKIPICPTRRIRFTLKHTLLTDKQEVCLIVPDLQRGRGVDHEATIEHYEELLRSKNVKSIKRILPMRQLKVEYDQYELKRRLCGYYDYFLVVGNISGHVVHMLGKIFIEKRKAPVPLKLDAPNLEETIENALKKSTLSIHSKGTSFLIQFGHSEMTTEQLTDNLKAVVDKLITDFPGGWSNIRSLHLKTDKSISVPVYYTLKNPNLVNVPVTKPIRPKRYVKITDELSTKEVGDPKVTVHPGGKVEYKKRKLGTTKNQLRKINQGRVQKISAKLRAKREKLKAKLKKVETGEAAQENTPEKQQTKSKKEKKSKENIPAEQQTVEKKSKKHKKSKVNKESTSTEQQTVETKSKKQKKSKVNKENTPAEQTFGKKSKKQKKNKVDEPSEAVKQPNTRQKMKAKKQMTENAEKDKKKNKKKKIKEVVNV